MLGFIFPPALLLLLLILILVIAFLVFVKSKSSPTFSKFVDDVAEEKELSPSVSDQMEKIIEDADQLSDAANKQMKTSDKLRKEATVAKRFLGQKP